MCIVNKILNSFPFQPTQYYIVQKVDAQSNERLVTIRNIKKKKNEIQTFYENALVKSKIPAKLIDRIIDTEERHNKRKISKVKLKGIREPKWIDNESFSFRRIHN